MSTTIPFTDSYTYQNGVKTGYNHSDWTAVAGGYVLGYQDLYGYDADGTLNSGVSSVITPAPKPVLTTSC